MDARVTTASRSIAADPLHGIDKFETNLWKIADNLRELQLGVE